MISLKPLRRIVNAIKVRPQEGMRREQERLSLNMASQLLQETAEKMDQAASSLQNADGALSILQAEVSELKNFCKELILYEHDRKNELQKLENMSRKYTKMFQQLEIEIPALLSQISLWNEVYSRDRQNQPHIPLDGQRFETTQLTAVETREVVPS